jgi:hypothetical protein
MPPITDEQTDELKARRQRRKAGQAPPAVNGSTSGGGQSAGAARDLLRGLITDGARRDEETSAALDPGSESKPAAPANPEREEREASEPAPRTPHGGEAIDELIRRVKDSAAGAAVGASSTLQQRRPKGTADLARDAATSRAAARRRTPEAELRNTDVAPIPKKHRRTVGRDGAAVRDNHPFGHAGQHWRNERASGRSLFGAQLAASRRAVWRLRRGAPGHDRGDRARAPRGGPACSVLSSRGGDPAWGEAPPHEARPVEASRSCGPVRTGHKLAAPFHCRHPDPVFYGGASAGQPEFSDVANLRH